MTYIQYFHKGVITGNLIPACGDRAVVILDSRQSLATWKQDAIKFNGYHRPVYDAYQIMQGASFTRSNPVTEVISL